MKHIITFLIIALLSLSAVSAIDCNSIAADVLDHDIRLPGAIPYKNERINLEVSGTAEGYAVIENRLVTKFNCTGTLDDYTYKVKLVNWEILEEIASTEKVADRLNKAFKDDEIVLEGKTAGKKFKGFMTRIGIRFASWFS